MADAFAPVPEAGSPAVVGAITELKVSGNLMTLDSGLYCLFQQPGTVPAPADGSGLPGVRITVPPRAGQAEANGTITIRGLHDDGWLGPRDGAALVRVSGGPAQILITVYQSPDHPPDAAPRLQVVPLASAPAAQAPAPELAAAPVPAPAKPAEKAVTEPAPANQEIVAHIQRVGDIGVALGAWMGKPGGGDWIEGFAITPRKGLAAADIEYQAVLGKGWYSPWITDGKFCGSRGMALPLLGFNLRLRGKAAEQYICEYRACFVDGSRTGPIPAGKACAAESLSPLEAFQISLRPRAKAAPVKAKAPMAAKPKAKPAAKPAPKAKPALPARKRGR